MYEMAAESVLSLSGQGVEVLAKAERRKFSLGYKLRILGEADRCTRPGELGVLLRREGLYSSTLSNWRRARARGDLAGSGVGRRGPKARSVDAGAKRIMKLERENRRLKRRLERAEAVIEVQKKVSELLGVDLPEPDSGIGKIR
jgi:transposase